MKKAAFQKPHEEEKVSFPVKVKKSLFDEAQVKKHELGYTWEYIVEEGLKVFLATKIKP